MRVRPCRLVVDRRRAVVRSLRARLNDPGGAASYACTRRRPGPPALYTAAGMHATRCPLLTHGRPTCNRQRGVRYCRLSRRPAARKVRASRARANQKTAGIQKSGRTFTDALGRPELFRADRWIDARVRVRVHCRCTLPAARAKRSDRHRRWGRPTQGPPRRASGRGGWRCMVVHYPGRQNARTQHGCLGPAPAGCSTCHRTWQ